MPRDNDTGDLERWATLHLLSDVERDRFLSQQRFSTRLGIAVGLTNAYVKRCIKKGWIKMRQAPARRYLYYITPKGFSEKSRLVAEYLTSSFSFFRLARAECLEVLKDCEKRGWRRVALAGAGELAEIATLAARETGIELVAVIAPGRNIANFAGLPVVGGLDDLADIDAVMITDIDAPQAMLELLRDSIADDRIVAPSLLHVSRERPAARRRGRSIARS